MNVKELIEKLKSFDGDLEVCYPIDEGEVVIESVNIMRGEDEEYIVFSY